MTPNLWTLPETVHFADTDWRVHTDFRDVLEILRWLDGSADPALTDSERWYVALALFYRDFSLMPPVQYREACEAMATFVQAGRPDGGPCAPRLMDWQQDAALIAAGTLFLLARFLPGLPWLVIWQVLPAAGLILLGCEVLYFSARPGECRCDFGSVVLCLLMMGGCFGVSTLMLLAQMLGRGCTIHL